jgi:hypothetical protein
MSSPTTICKICFVGPNNNFAICKVTVLFKTFVLRVSKIYKDKTETEDEVENLISSFNS